MADTSLLSRLDGIEARFEEVSTLITDPSVIADMKRYVRLTKEYKDLEKLTGATRRYRNLLGNIQEAREILDTENDDDMRAMAKEELDSANAELPNLEEEIRILYVAMTRAKHLLVLANKDSKFFNNVEFNRNPYIVSYLRWLSEIDNGEFIKKFEKN
mgnify:CR=1 FL=1